MLKMKALSKSYGRDITSSYSVELKQLIKKNFIQILENRGKDSILFLCLANDESLNLSISDSASNLGSKNYFTLKLFTNNFHQ